jgi:hypothetical protein
MNNNEDQRIQNLLKQAMPSKQGELQRDLWPRMLNRLAGRPIAAVPWFDWALLAALTLMLLLAPRSIPLLLYHL